jgi:hypothetical protein
MRTGDDDVRDLFANANPDSGPRLRMSAADIAARGRRVHRRRRQLAAVSGTVAVMAVAAVLTTTLTRPSVAPAGPGVSTQVPITHTGPKPLPTTDHGARAATTPPATHNIAPTTTITATSRAVPTP